MVEEWIQHPAAYPRFEGIRSFMRMPYVNAPTSQASKQIDAVILGAPFDTTATYRTGSRFGPEAVRRVSSLLRPAHVFHRVRPADVLNIADGGDIPVIPGNTDRSYDFITNGLTQWLSAGAVPLVIGGDHSIALPELRAIAKEHGPVALIQFDAHQDTWDNYWGERYTHGTPFKRAVEEGLIDVERSTQIGMRGTVYDPDDIEQARSLGFSVITSEEVRAMGLNEVMEHARRRAGRGKVFVSFDIDFLDPAYAPGTGTPEIGGFTTYEAQYLVRRLAELNFVGFDVVEVMPSMDPAETTALAGATIVFEFLALLARSKSSS